MRYVRIPREISTRELKASDFCFSPGRFVRFIPPPKTGEVDFVPLDRLVKVRAEVANVRKGDFYQYAEIGDIDIDTGGICFRLLRGYELPTQRPAIARTGDILISTVRTYRKGIGFVAETGDNLVTTNAVLNLCSVTDEVPQISLLYIYAFLRTDFFVEQVWSLLNRGVYPRMDTGALHQIQLPVTRDKNGASYVANLALAIVEKEQAIRRRSEAISAAINTELESHCDGALFGFEHPTLAEVQTSRRFDTGLYCRGFKAFKHRIEHYRPGALCLSKMGVKSRRGPNLAVSVIGKSIYTDKYKPGWYELIRPVNISEYGTLSRREWLGSTKRLPIVKQGDLILGCEGFEKGRSLVLVEAPERCTTNFHGTVLFWPGAELWQIIFVRCFLAYLREHGVIDWVGVGGSGGHMSPEYFDYLPFPRFPDHVQQQIASRYHKPSLPPKRKQTLENFVAWHREWNADLGIWELDRELKVLQRALSAVQEEIIGGRPVPLPF